MKYRKIVAIYLFAIITYGIIVSLFTSTVHVGVDEELYLALAKSFHYLGRFEINGDVVDYNCVLYSMLISIAYYFYSPRTILFTMRLIGVVTMCSSVFPSWLLASKILKSEKQVLSICIILLGMPYMFDSAYIMQETLSYPLFLWTVFWGYCAFAENKSGKIWLVAVFSSLCFFSKTYLFFIPVVVNICFFKGLKGKLEKKIIGKLMLYNCVYLFCTVVLYAFVWIVNGGISRKNHYARQFSWLFPITSWTIISAVIGIVVYGVFFLLNTGVLPIPAVLFQRKKFKEHQWLFDFTIISSITLTIETVILIVLTEEGVPTIPHKFLFRYFHIFVPLILIAYMKVANESEFLNVKRIQGGVYISIALAICYFVIMQGNTRQSIMDGHLFLLVENVSKHVIPYADVLVMCFIGVVFTIFIIMIRKSKMGTMNIYNNSCLIFLVLFWLLNCVQLPFYTNQIAGGKQIQNDSIQIAEYLNQNSYQNVYFAVDDEIENSGYIRNFYGYIKQPFCTIDAETELLGKLEQCVVKSAIIVRKGYQPDGVSLEKVDIMTEKIDLYVPRNNYLERN